MMGRIFLYAKNTHEIFLYYLDTLLSAAMFLLNEPVHDKTNKMACASSEDSDQPGHPPGLINLRCPHKESLLP